ncbi:winged helix-turn-helix domain-containing protein [bacterium]|nr:winged helix-turn-helix domain-containing protein [bacterium]
MKDQIGITAGKLWNYLRDKDETNIAALPKALDEKALVVQMALGWLAREDKVEFRIDGAKNLVSIVPSEKGN